jgi:hypothetical protein
MSYLYIKRNANTAWRKSFINGGDNSYFGGGNSWEAITKINWNTFQELELQLLPYLTGKDEHCALMLGETDKYFDRNKEAVKDEKLDYLLLDIETDLPEYEDISTDLHKIRNWLIEEYNWFKETTGMFMHFTNSAGVHYRKDGNWVHKQVRVRVFVKINQALNEAERIQLLEGYLKTKATKEINHIDRATLERARATIISPPKIRDTKTTEIQQQTLFFEGDAVNTNQVIKLRPVSPSSTKTTSEALSKSTLKWFNEIEAGHTYQATFNTIWSIVIRSEDWYSWKERLTRRLKEVGSGRRGLDGTYRYCLKNVRSWFFLHELNYKNHNKININEEFISKKGVIDWLGHKEILIKSGTGTGKTTALQKLLDDNPNQSVVYIGKNESYVRNASADLGLEDYKDLNKYPYEDEDGNAIAGRDLWKVDRLAICYNSLPNLQIPPTRHLKKKNIVICDEARQLLTYMVESDTVEDKETIASILVDLVKEADLVVLLDAGLDDTARYALEKWRGVDNGFAIYVNAHQPLKDKTAYLCRSPAEIIRLARELVQAGNRIAIVGDFSDKPGAKHRISTFVSTLSEDVKMEHIVTLHSGNSREETQQEIILQPEKHLLQKLEDGMQVFIASPSITAGWDYLGTEEQHFEYVLGYYPNGVLTAPEILQQLRRFRRTKSFYVWIRPNYRNTQWEINNLERVWKKVYGYTSKQFIEPIFEEIKEDKGNAETAFNNKELIRRNDATGIDWLHKEVKKSARVSLCNPRLHFDLLWTDEGGIIDVSPYFLDELDPINKDYLQQFQLIGKENDEKLFRAVKNARTISTEEYLDKVRL